MREPHAVLLENRVRKTYQHLKKRFIRQNVDCFRLYDWDIPEVRARVDYYAGHLVVAEYEREQTRQVDGYLEALGAAAARAVQIPPECVHLKTRRTRPREGARYEKLGNDGTRSIVHEGALRYYVNLDDFVDTGLFPDHRTTRKLLAERAAGRTFLNLYCYTGAFTCAMAQAGACETVSVDLSSRYLNWTRDNLELNQLGGGKHELVEGDVREVLERTAKASRRFDIVFVDPPSFSTVGAFETSGGFDVLRDHRALVELAFRCLEPDGLLVFSTNHQRFSPNFPSNLTVTEMTHRTVPEDFRNRQVHRSFFITARA